MPNGRTGGFNLKTYVLSRLLNEFLAATVVGFGNAERPLTTESLRRKVTGWKDQTVFIEEQDSSWYILHLTEWVTVGDESPLFSPLRQLHARSIADRRDPETHRSVNYDFVHRETRDCAFQDPELLLRITGDPTPVGRNTMARMWNAVAQASGIDAEATGAQFATWERRWDDGTRVGIMKLPEADGMMDATMAAVVVKPVPRRWFFFRPPPEVRFFTLENAIRGDEPSKPNNVVLCEWRLHEIQGPRGSRPVRHFEHALLDVEPPQADPDALNAAIKSMALHTPIALSVTRTR